MVPRLLPTAVSCCRKYTASSHLTRQVKQSENRDKFYETLLASNITAEPEIDGNVLKIRWTNGQNSVSRFHTEWLRFNCQCAKCRQPYSNQRLLESTHVPPNTTLASAVVRDGKLLLSWTEDSHEGHISLAWLRETEQYSELPTKQHKGILHRFGYDALEKSKEIRGWFYRRLLDDGFGLVCDLPKVAGTVKKFVEDIFGIHVQRTIYGEIFDVVSTPNPVNVAYSNVELKPHIDLVYYESPPGLQLLHCLQFDETVQGGESILVDGMAVAEEMRKKYPKEFEILTSIPATFEKIHFDRELPVWMRYRRPHIAVNNEKQVTGIFWAPQFEGPLFAPLENVSAYYAGHRIFSALIDDSPSKLQFRLKPGEMIVFNNRRMLHGRNAFLTTGGSRHLQGCYVHVDEFKSQAQIALMDAGEALLLPRVANQSY